MKHTPAARGRVRAGVAVAMLAVGVLAIALAGCAGSGTGGGSAATPQKEAASSPLDPANPVQVEVWTYYNGIQQQTFEEFVAEFNDTRGKELGVVVSHASQGGVNDLSAAVIAAAEKRVGASAMPDAFMSYPDTAYAINDSVADISGYFTDEEKGRFVDSFLAEGDLDGTGGIKVLPVSKSTETLQINLTDWNRFAEATGASLDDLSSVEGITRVAQLYYAWTDAQTEAPDDGLPFFGRDSMANYLITGFRQLGCDLFDIEGGICDITVDKAAARRLWDNYYVPMVQGWFSADGRFRSDLVKTGDLLAYVGSSSSVVYFPAEVTVDDQTSYAIELCALPAPTFENATPCAVSQGAGFVVAKADEKTELACVEFLKWLTEDERTISLAIGSGYVPSTKTALSVTAIESVAQTMEKTPNNYLASLPATLDTIEAGVYANPPFEHGVEVRNVIEGSLSGKAVADQAAVNAAVAAGATRASAVAPYLTDECFEAWYAEFTSQLDAALAS